MHKTAGPGAGAKAAAASVYLKAGRFRLDREELLRSRRGYRRAQRVRDVVLSLLGLTVLADDLSLGLICLYVGCTVVLYGFSLLERPAHMD